VFDILKRNLPYTLYIKLKKYVTGDYKTLQCHLNWKSVKSTLDKLSLNQCSKELVELLSNVSLSDKCVKTFHIGDNYQNDCSTEPTVYNTCKMIFHFLFYIYQRNILASLIKYILLKDTITLFEQSILTNNKKGIFCLINERLNEIIFECILTAFNGSNYDNYLIANYLIIIQTKLNQKIKIFKKGASISTIYLNFPHNFVNRKLKGKQLQRAKWPSFVYIKDIRNLVAANMSLDKIGKLFNVKESKLCFPYNQATSINKLKTLTSLQPNNETFWIDTFLNKTISLQTRLDAELIFHQQKCKNLYEFGNYYLIQDCLLLHSIVLTLYNNYLKDNINIVVRRNFSQSSLSYHQLFIIEPSKQIKYINAPKSIRNTLCNYIIKQAVTGGLCTSFVHGPINKDIKINEHLNYISDPSLDMMSWPNFNNCKPWKKDLFNESASSISTFDIRSLYPSAALKKIPVNSPLFYSRFIKEDFENVKNKNLITFNLQGFCENVQSLGDNNTDVFKLLNKSPLFHNEFYAIQYFLTTLPKHIKILRFQSSFTALGQLYFREYPVDGFLSYINLKDNKTYINIIQYNSVYYHGHTNNCLIINTEKAKILQENTIKVKQNIKILMQNFNEVFGPKLVQFDYIEISDCDFFLHKIPRDSNFIFSYKNHYSYNSFLQNIYNKQLTGFLVLKNLEIKKQNQNPIFGFIIQKVEYGLQNLSPYTSEQFTHLATSKRVVGLHKSKSFIIISTEYFNWLRNTFGFEKQPDLYHALLFQTDYYLKDGIETKLKLRKNLKSLIKHESNLDKKQSYEIQAELIKLMLNSCYGFTLCNLNSSKFKTFVNTKTCPKKRNHINSCVQIDKNIFIVEKKTNKNEQPFQTLLGHVGCYILFHSKIILLKRLYFLLKYLNPTKAQLLYMDTDSAHFLLKHPTLIENVDDNLKNSFRLLFNKHFETGSKISGIWVDEGSYDSAEYLGEKSYTLYNETNDKYVTHMKGLNTFFQNKYVQNKINKKDISYIIYNQFMKSPDFIIYKTCMSKNVLSNFAPNKRYFVCATGSLPLKFG